MNDKALYIVKTLVDYGFSAVYAGGCVRDMLLGLEPQDIDIATNALPDQIESIFPKTIPIGKSFGVIVVIVEGEQFEVATFRSDGEYCDGRHPSSVSFCSLEEDAQRRDITINGMFYNPLSNEFIDVVSGQTDLKHKIIRFIGDPEKRIEEDKLRMLRAIRFAVRFNFEIDEESFVAIIKNSEGVNDISEERVGSEFTKILRCKNKRRALELLFESGILKIVLPQVYWMKGCEQPPEFHPEGDVWEHTIKALSLLKEDASDELLWATLLHDCGKPQTQTFEDRIRFTNHENIGSLIGENILWHLKFSNEFSGHVACMIQNHMRMGCAKEMKISKLKRLMNLYKFEEHLELHRVDCESSNGDLSSYNFILEKQKEFEKNPEKVRLDKLKRLVNGNDLLNLGYKQGPLLRKILTDIEDQILEEKIDTKEEAIEYIKINYKL